MDSTNIKETVGKHSLPEINEEEIENIISPITITAQKVKSRTKIFNEYILHRT